MTDLKLPHEIEIITAKGMIMDYAASVSGNRNMTAEELSKILKELSEEILK